MTNVVPFKTPQRAKGEAPRSGKPAQILFFTGVRYVRDEAESDPAVLIEPRGRSLHSPRSTDGRGRRRKA